MPKMPKPVVLIILDGWGYSENRQHNPISSEKTPVFDQLMVKYPHTLLNASGLSVGLPEGQMGNSEVGHLHIGAGRKVPQDLTRIRADIKSGDFCKNPVFIDAIKEVAATNKAVHVLGLLSPGGVHSHENQILALIKMMGEHGIKKNYLHAILDGRDTPPRSATASIKRVESLYQQLPGGKIATLIGRYYAMDRDKRWERTEKAYSLYTQGIADCIAENAQQGLESAYDRGENDEFVKATAIAASAEQAVTINDGDVIIFMNFRADRARQLSHAFTDVDFPGFKRKKQPTLADFIMLTLYAKDINGTTAYLPRPIHNTLGEYVSASGLKQLRIAETEKYAHVTYFLNGGIEKPFAHEDRLLIPSPKVATYDLQPEMSAIELTDKLIASIESGQYDTIICNFANPDMVGHTGIEDAANIAVITMDKCMGRIIESLNKAGGEALITADHGNIEHMFDEKTGQPHTAHTNNPVPLIYVGRKAHFMNKTGALDDVAPTLLYVLGLTPPDEMTGTNLLTMDS